MDPSANSPPVPRFVFVAYYPEGPHAGPITIGLFGVQDGALLPLFSTREKAIDFAVRVLGTPLLFTDFATVCLDEDDGAVDGLFVELAEGIRQSLLGRAEHGD